MTEVAISSIKKTKEFTFFQLLPI